VTLQIAASLIDAAKGVIYDRHMFIVHATDKFAAFSREFFFVCNAAIGGLNVD
jgi:hypothetical protein